MNYKVLFVCWGNICRSPSAEAVFNKVIEDRGMSDRVVCDSAGTISHHNGEKADPRMQQHAIKRGYHLTSISRKVEPEFDFEEFDMIIAMDDDNVDSLRYMSNARFVESKIYKMMDFGSHPEYDSVPDPYYGGEQGFELVLDLLEDACNGLADHIQKKLAL